jgi:serine/threonine protein phosphatase 1
MKYYVVADVHGYYSYLIKALEEAGFFDETELCKLVVCGDLLDRGEEARELVEFMMGLLKEDRLIYILGNHEDLFIQCLQEISRGEVYRIALGMSHHYRNGTWDTLLQLADMEADDAFNDPAELCEAYHSIGICVFKCSAC